MPNREISTGKSRADGTWSLQLAAPQVLGRELNQGVSDGHIRREISSQGQIDMRGIWSSKRSEGRLQYHVGFKIIGTSVRVVGWPILTYQIYSSKLDEASTNLKR